MTTWREHAERGEWWNISCWEIEKAELSELAKILKSVVPRATRGHGTETYEGHIFPRDADSFETYEAAQLLEDVQRAIDSAYRTNCITEAVLFAMFCLHKFGMVYEGWHDTYLFWDDAQSGWVQFSSDAAVEVIERRNQEMSRISELPQDEAIQAYKDLELDEKPWRNCQPISVLFQLDSIEEYTPLWHALNILSWHDSMTNLLLEDLTDEALMCAFQMGISYATLNDKENQIHAVRGKTVVAAAKKGGDARKSALAPTTSSIVDKMRRLIESGQTVRSAAEILARKGIGTSASANRKLWYDHR